MSLVGLPRTVRTMKRLRVIAGVLTRHGFGHLVERLHLRRYVPFGRRLVGDAERLEPSTPTASIGHRFVLVCEELGPTFVKLGQMLSARPDLLPAEMVHQLQRLQDQVAPFDPEAARQIVATELGAPVEDLFQQFEPAPFASGSIAQAHRAVARDGRNVVVKVKRPGIDATIQLDIHIMRWLAAAIERNIPELRVYRPEGIVEEFERTIQRELDFINEASATARFGKALADQPKARVPAVRWELTSPSVLTLEWIKGVRLEDALADRDGQIDRTAVAQNLADLFLTQYFELGMFHADPHPGNLLIAPPDTVGLLDFGIVGLVDDDLASSLAFVLLAIVNREIEILIDVLADLGALADQTDRRLLRRELREWLDKYYGLPLKRLVLKTIFIELTDLLRRHDVRLPRDFVLLGKSLVTVGGVIQQLDPNLNLFALIQPMVRKMIADRFAPPRLLRAAGISGWHLVSIFRNAPRQVRDILRRVSRGPMQINIRHENLDHLASEIDRAGNRLAIAVVIAATIIGSSMLVSVEPAADIAVLGIVSLRVFGFFGYFVAFVLGLWLVYGVWRSGKLS
ncbi:MAG TPA: AarF/ABC1/UbiB kinase family protein [Phycisphaerae bacterium]|nr:AarF/ABC1/UbiB kinase family protein [Phycisphaerae bacterium]